MTDIPEIKCNFKTEDALYLAYMPFIKGGGLFIRTKGEYALSSQVRLIVQLMDEQEEYIIDGTIVWVTPKGAQGNKPAGVGVQLPEKNRTLTNKIETYLAGMLKSTQITDSI